MSPEFPGIGNSHINKAMSKIIRYYKDARERVKRRKSPWNWILLPLAIIGIGITGFLMLKGLLVIQRHLIPADVILSGRTPAGSFLMFVPIFFPSFTIGFMFANFIAWCIPPARRAMDSEAKGVKGASFKEAMKLLSIVSIIILMIVGPLSLLGVFNYFYVKPDGIYINPLVSFKERHYKWSDIRRISASCLIERDNFHWDYIIYMKDKIEINIWSEQRFKFIDAYDKIKPFIKTQPHIAYDYSIGDREIERLRSNYSDYAEKIIKIIRNEE